MLQKINLEHLELLWPWGLRYSYLEAPGVHDTNFNTQCYKDAIDLELLEERSILDKLFFSK